MEELTKQIENLCLQLQSFREQVEQADRELLTQVNNIINTLNGNHT